jgi:flagellar protein FliJ
MKRFVFALQKLLELREFREREAELELARILGRCVAVDNRLRELAVDKSRIYRNRFSAGRSIADLQADEHYLLRLDREKDRLIEERAKLELLRLEAQKKYLEASKEKKVIEKLKEKKTVEYRKFVETESIKAIDDIANNMSHAKLVEER